MKDPVDQKAVPSVEERRRAPRRRTLKAGKILSTSLTLSFDCVIRNISETGARLKIDSNLAVPNEFYLYQPGDHLICKAQVAWRHIGEIGVRFLEPPVSPRSHPDSRIGRINLY